MFLRSFEIFFLKNNLINWGRSQQSPQFIHVDELDSQQSRSMIHLEKPNVPDAAIEVDQDQLDHPRVSNDEVHKEKPNAPTMKHFANAIEDLVLPSFGAANSVSDADAANAYQHIHITFGPRCSKLTVHFHDVTAWACRDSANPSRAKKKNSPGKHSIFKYNLFKIY